MRKDEVDHSFCIYAYEPEGMPMAEALAEAEFDYSCDEYEKKWKFLEDQDKYLRKILRSRLVLGPFLTITAFFLVGRLEAYTQWHKTKRIYAILRQKEINQDIINKMYNLAT